MQLAKKSIKLNLKSIFVLAGIIIGVFGIIVFITNILSFYKINNNVADPYWDYYYGVLAGIFVSIIIFIFPFKHKQIVLFGWLLKFLIVFFLNYFFESSYGIDGFGYHRVALTFNPVLVPFNATANIYSFTSVLYGLFVSSFRLAYIIFAFIGFIGQYLFWIAISMILKSYKKNILILLMTFPSFVFWSSYLGKDPFALLLISVYAIGLAYFLNNNYKKAFGLIVLSFILFIYLRFWMIGILGLSFVFSLLIMKKVNPVFKKVLFFSGIAGGLIIGPIILMQFGIVDINTFVLFLRIWTQGWAKGGSAQVLEFSSPMDLVMQIPWLMFTALFRPLLYEASNPFQLVAGIENSILLIFFVIAVFKYLRYKLWKDELINIFLIHIFIWTFIYGFMSYQNLGTAVRFKLQILPFLLMFIYFTLKRNDVKNILTDTPESGLAYE